MKLHINIDKSISEPEILITTDQMTEEVNRIVDFINRIEETGTMLSGIRNGRVELLDQEKLIRIYAENGRVYARTDRDSYQLKLRLYELEERLDSSLFVRISNSEIVNLKKVKSLDLSFTGTICMELTNGEVSYVSRRYVARIKKLLGL
ncbi:MAG: LytTR family DNA-binding domain-containing protein [Lachnospiraceae bacterium]|nr:LytTR family DNA-binding domain-containing protein [Lachnospiraceae bacterium]